MGIITDWISSLLSISSTDSASEPQSKAEQGDAEAQSPVIRMVNHILSEAVEQGASDIHMEPTETGLQIRHRVDGVLRTSMVLPKLFQGAVINRVKIMAKLEIWKKQLPYDGRIDFSFEGRRVDLQVSTVPDRYGEKVVIKIPKIPDLDHTHRADRPIRIVAQAAGRDVPEQVVIPRCADRGCKHYVGFRLKRESPLDHIFPTMYLACKAFPYPMGIPDEIAFGNNDHLAPYADDNGIQFEKGANVCEETFTGRVGISNGPGEGFMPAMYSDPMKEG
jgi:hypothetical protein